MPIALGEPHQLALDRDEPLVDVVKLVDQRLDAGLVQRQRLHSLDDFLAQLLIAARRASCDSSVFSPTSWSCSLRSDL